MTVQLQILRPSKQDRKLQQDLLLGIVQGLEAPVDLYVSLNDLRSGYNVRYVLFRMGGETTLLGWGNYNVGERKFYLEQACRPKLSLLSQMMRKLPQKEFTYSANSVKDRILEAMGEKLPLSSGEYLKLKYALSYEAGDQTVTELGQRFPEEDLVAWWEERIEQDGVETEDAFETAQLRAAFVLQQEQLVKNYETKLNRTDTDRDALGSLSESSISLFLQIINDFNSSIGRDELAYPEYVKALPNCLSELECQQGETLPLVCSIYEHVETIDLR